MPRTAADRRAETASKKAALRQLLTDPATSGQSKRRIAAAVPCSQHLVNQVLFDLAADNPVARASNCPTHRIGRDGKRYKASKPGSGVARDLALPAPAVSIAQENSIQIADCLDILNDLPVGCAQLVVADPPFNIKLPYDGYHDDQPAHEYLEWLQVRLRAARRVLSPTGSMFVCVAQQYQPDVHIILRDDLGMTVQNVIAWHFGFARARTRRFTQSYTPIIFASAHPRRYTFNGDAVAVPAIRSTRWKDKRSPTGVKVPDDVWTIPRLPGNSPERLDHPCQMPAALLERIVAVASNPNDLVLEPFAGTGTACVAAKIMGRRFLGIEVSEQTAAIARNRVMPAPARSVARAST